MAEQQENLVTIVGWPTEGAAVVQHHFMMEKPCPVSIAIEEHPLNIDLRSLPEKPFNVNMDMKVKASDVIPVCIKLCEPICAESEYKLELDICEKPFACISLRGRTRIFGCPTE